MDALTGHVRDAFDARMLGLPPDYLNATAERALLEDHAYASLTVLGSEHFCATMIAGVSERSLHAFTTYVPHDVAPRLPLLGTFRARLLAEPHPRQDPSESSTVALRTLAIARLIPQ